LALFLSFLEAPLIGRKNEAFPLSFQSHK
jgi:hypothetical protein